MVLSQAFLLEFQPYHYIPHSEFVQPEPFKRKLFLAESVDFRGFRRFTYIS